LARARLPPVAAIATRGEAQQPAASAGSARGRMYSARPAAASTSSPLASDVREASGGRVAGRDRAAVAMRGFAARRCRVRARAPSGRRRSR
jgi:hypothetical protein